MIKKVQNKPDSKSGSFPNSRKVYLKGKIHSVNVPMREISQSESSLPNGDSEENKPIRVYDTSGAWGDPDYHNNSEVGLPLLRNSWIHERNDVEKISGRVHLPIDNGYLAILLASNIFVTGNAAMKRTEYLRQIIALKESECIAR